MGRRRGSPEGLPTDVLKALGDLDARDRESSTLLRRDGASDASGKGGTEAVTVPIGPPAQPAPPSGELGHRSEAVLATWEDEPDTKRFVSSGEVAAAKPADRRAARRVSLVVPVTIRADHEDFEGTSEDISISGIFVRTPRLLQSGKRVHVRFDMPSGQIVAKGVIVRFRTPAKGMAGGVGLCFEALSDELLQCIETFCESSDSVR